MFMRMKFLPLIAVAAMFVFAGCGPKAAPPTSIMDSPEYHYRTGLKYLDTDQLDNALKSFERAISLDPDSPLGHIGKGLALGKKGDFKNAFEAMEKGKDLDKKGIEANIGMIELNKEFVAEANAEWAVIQKIQRAAPGSEIGKKIALIDKIDRADIAALFEQEMDIEKLFTKRGGKVIDTTFKAPTETTTRFSPEKVETMEPATDIAKHWLKPSIDVVLKLRVRGLEPGPDHTFAPDKLITKSEFALMLEDILIKVTGDEKLATKYLGATSPFPDVRSDHYAFSAIMTATSRGFLEADKATGEFKPGDAVSGADALLTIREFKNQLKF